MKKKPNCHECIFKKSIPGDAHISCSSKTAIATGHPHGIKMGWFFFPVNFDPTWLEECNSFKTEKETKKDGEDVLLP